MSRLIIMLILISSGCSILSKKKDHNRVIKQDRIALDNYLMGEKFRRSKKYKASIRYFFKASSIYRNKFDYLGEFNSLLKIGYLYAKMRKGASYDAINKRLLYLSEKVTNGAYQLKELDAKWSVESGETNEALKKIEWLINNGSEVDRVYYLAMYIKLSGPKSNQFFDILLSSNKVYGTSLDALKKTESPEALLFVNKTLAEVALDQKNKDLFELSINNCEKIINYFELVDFSNEIRKLKNKYN